MTTLTPRITSQFLFATINTFSNPHSFLGNNPAEIVDQLQNYSKKAPSLFSQVIVIRALVFLNPDGTEQYKFVRWSDNGPFTFKQFIEIINTSPNISNKDWLSHLRASSEVKASNLRRRSI